jgi:hypothetical protein
LIEEMTIGRGFLHLQLTVVGLWEDDGKRATAAHGLAAPVLANCKR